MGYGFYTIGRAERPCGYMVIATCDSRGCETVIDRGMGYLCGVHPHDERDDEPGCGRYYCGAHLGWVGPRGGCSHRRSVPWGRVISDMAPSPDGELLCLDPTGHEGPHAWAAA